MGHLTVGVDEAGRGCLAGSVYASAVVLNNGDESVHSRITDSKLIKKESTRVVISEEIKKACVAFSVTSSSPELIDEINILEATMQAMRNCIEEVHSTLVELGKMDKIVCLVDGTISPYKKVPIPSFVERVECITKGDLKKKCIGAASILAKVEKDREMNRLHLEFPQYGWNTNKSYGTKSHLSAIKEFGLSKYHRKSYKLKGHKNLKIS